MFSIRQHFVRLFILALVLTISSASFAQISTVAGIISGTVSDSGGAVIPHASVTLRNLETGQTRQLVTSDQGEFAASELPASTYELSVSQSAFATYHHSGITLLMGRTVRMNITLQPETVREQMTVTTQPDALEPQQTTLVTNVEAEQIAELPVQSRNYLNFALLAPGVTDSRTMQSSAGQASLGVPDSGFSFGGLRGRSNSISIDGVDNNDEYTGASRTELSLEIVREFQVINTGISAESGGASGGAINVVTRTGANTLHGDAFLFAQNAATNARDPLGDAGHHPGFNRYRAGLAIGGPVRKNRTFYYAAAEQEHTRGQEASDIDHASTQAINDVLLNGAFPGMRPRQLTTNLFGTARAETELSGKIDHQLSNSQTLMLRYAFTNNRETAGSFNTNSLADFSARGTSFTKDHAFVAALTSVIDPKFVNDFRLQIASRWVILRTTERIGPAVEIAGIADFGRPYSGNGERRENHFQFVDTVSQNRGTHAFKFGATANRVSLDASVLDGFGGQFIFPTVEDFAAGRPASWTQAFGNPKTDFAVTSYGAFFQDHWTPRRLKRLAFDLGVRYDFEKLPDRFSPDFNNVSPRLGVAFSPIDKWVLRSAFGIYYDRQVLAFLNRAMQLDGERGFLQVAHESLAPTVFRSNAGAMLLSPRPDIKPSIYVVERRLATPYSQQISTGVERLITSNTTVSATYQFVRGMKLPRTVNVNLPPPPLLTPQNASALGVANPVPQQIGRAVFGPARLDPAYNNVYQLQDRASSSYHGLSLSVNRRLANEVAFSSSYTWSKTIDNASDFDEQPQNPYDLRAERSFSRNDQRHRFVFSGLFDLPFGDEEDRRDDKDGGGVLAAVLGNIELAPIFVISSGTPVNPLVGFDASQSGAFPLSSRPLGSARNSLRSPAIANLDLRIVKFFKVKPHGRVDFVAEMFNVLNRKNVVSSNDVFGRGMAPLPSFLNPTALRRLRQAQFSIDFEF